ncbi:MAG: type VII secretion protein EccE [Stackebrandtia sp.]
MTTIGLVARRKGLGFGPVRLTQLVACEVVAAVAFLSWTLPPPTPYIVTPLGVIVMAAVIAAGVRGLGYRTLLSLRRRKLRKGEDEAAEGGDALTALAPGLRIVGVSERNTEYGVAFDGTGWFTGIALRHRDATDPTGLDVGALGVIVNVLTDPSAAVSGIQLVNHLVPTPSAEISPESPCTQSYAELLGDDPVVSHQMTWLAVRLDIPTAARTAAERGGCSTGARRAVASVTMRLVKRLTDAGVDHRVLGPDSLRVALTHSVSGETVSAALSRQASERWGSWQLGMLAQITYGVEGRIADLNALRKLWMSMAVLSTSFATVSTSFHPPDEARGGDGVWMRSMLRVAYDEELNDGVPDELVDAAAECGVRLWRCDGEQAAATYASAPTGGAFAR